MITSELRNKGAFFKIHNASTVSISNSATTINNSDAGTLTIKENGSLITEGNLVNASSATIKIDGTLNIKGNFTNNATASLVLAAGSNGTVEFSGTVAQNIGGSAVTEFENFTINNTAGIVLASDIKIEKTLSFTDGIITTGASKVELTGTDADYVSGSGAGKYVLGNFRRNVTNNVTYTFPIGTAANYTKGELFVNSNTGLTYVDIAFTTSSEAVPPGLTVNTIAVDNFLDYGFWTLTPNGGLGAVNYNFSGQSMGHTDLGGGVDNYALITDIGAGWQNIGPHSASTQAYTPTTVLAKRQTLTQFGSYVIAYLSAPLYTAPATTEELRIKGATSIFKIHSASTVSISNSATTINNSDAGTLTIKENGSLITEGNLVNASSATIKIDGTLNIKGNFTNNATASLVLAAGSNGTVEFSGTVAQNIGGSAVTEFENFTINNTAGIVLASDIKIEKTLSFTDGIITTGASKVELTGTDADYVSGSGAGKYVLGNFRRNVTNNVTYTFPIGTAANYTKGELFVNSNTGLTYVDIAFTTSSEAVPPGLTVNTIAVDNFLDYGFWTLTPNGGLGAVNYNFSGQSMGHTDLGGGVDNYALITDIGAGWQNIGPHSASTQAYTPTTVLAKRQTLTQFGSYVIAYLSAPLYTAPPVTQELRIKSGAYYKIPANYITLVAGESTDVNNDIGGTIEVKGNLRMEGAWNNDGNADITDAIFAFEGDAAQTFGQPGGSTFKELVLNKTSEKLTLLGDIELSSQITLTSGNVDLDGHTITLQDGVTVSGSPSNSSHIIATDGEVFQKMPSTGTAYTIPIGDGTNYTPVNFTLNSATGLDASSGVSFSVTTAKHPSLDATEYINRYFDYNPTNISDPNYDITIFYTVADVVGTEANLSFAKYSSGDWTQNLGVLANTGNHSLSWAGATSFSSGTGAEDGGPLPVELITFSVEQKPNGDKLISWITASEINSDYFVIERSIDGVNFIPIGQTKGAGNSNQIIYYNFIDQTQTIETNYYRLKQFDLDGSYNYSNIISIESQDFIPQKFSFGVLPNPSNGQKIIIINTIPTVKNNKINIRITGIHGQMMYSEIILTDEEGNFKHELNNMNWAPGSYLVTCTDESNTQYTQKLIITR